MEQRTRGMQRLRGPRGSSLYHGEHRCAKALWLTELARGKRKMKEFDFEARRQERSEGQTEPLRKQTEINDLINHRARKLADSIKKYGESRCAIEITVEINEIVVTKKMTGAFLKIDNDMTISVDSQGTFAVKKGDYEKAKGANGQTGSLTEAEMIDVVAGWLAAE